MEKEEKNVKINIEKFVLFHKRRIRLLKKLVKEKIYGRLIFQISFLGVESLSKLLYPEENSSKKRFIELLSKAIKHEATEIYQLWRNPLIHEGFIATLWTTLEAWDDMGFISFPETDSIKSSVEYPPESIIAIYENLIDYFDDFFRKTNTKDIVYQIKP